MGTKNSGGFTPLFAAVVAGVVILSIVAGAGASLSTTSTNNATNSQANEGGPLSGTIDLADADTKLLGEAANDTAGWIVASAGDVNGDGVADVLVGAPRNDSAGENAGVAYVFYGPVDTGDISLSEADVKLTGVGAGDLAGAGVAAGDLNGDGRSDLVVGAPFNDSAGSNAGVVYVVYGSDGLSGTISLADADATFSGAAPGDQAGRSVATVNGSDGASDLLVGAPFADAAGNDSGAAYVLDGSGLASGSLADGATFTGAAAGDLAGSDVSSAGDFDGDGVDDLIVGARLNDTGGEDAGAAYLVSGANRFDGGSLADAALALSGAGAGDNAGYAVSDAGDVNDDGFDDVIVGAPLNDSAGANAGAAYVVYGWSSPAGTVPLADADLTLYGVAAGDRAGWDVSSAGSGDVNCDAFDDVLVGAPYNNSTGPNAGAAYVVHGADAAGDRSLLDADATFRGEGADDLAGWSVSEAEDANGDGDDDVLIGAPYNDSTGTDAGAAYLILGQCPEEKPTTTTERPTKTHTATATKSPTPKHTPTPTATATPKHTPTPTPKHTPTPTATPTPKHTPTPTPTPKHTTTDHETTVETTVQTTAKTTHTTVETTTKETTADTTTKEKTTDTTTKETTTESTRTHTTKETTDTTETTTESTTTKTTDTTTTNETTTTKETTTNETTTDTTTTNATTTTNDTTPTRDERSAISFIAFCVEGGEQQGNDPCPDGESLLVKFEWNDTTNMFEPEGGDPMGVTVTATEFKDNDPSEPVEATWTSVQEISTVVVKSGTPTCTYPGGMSGTVESCPASGGSPDLEPTGWFFPAIVVPLGALVAVRRLR